jgi:2-polyprenyl-3-methyl-5-hydroxy-6-metoxy-1,4-benzoquinol methylase
MSSASPEKYPITIIILTRDEADNIAQCVACLDWADEVILVDSGSTDGTIERARAARPDIRPFTNPFEDFGQQRNWALDHTDPNHDWIFFVDADERITPKCAEAIRRAVTAPGQYDGFFVCYRNIFLGRWIRHCKMFPTWQLRVLRRGRVRYRREGHGQREVMDGPAGYIREPFDHLDLSKGMSDWISKHHGYMRQEIEMIQRLRAEPLGLGDLLADSITRRRCLKRVGARLGGSPIAWFIYLYFIRLGFLDGRAGWVFCRLRMAQQIEMKAMLAEARSKGSAGPTDAVRFHDELARNWEGKYNKRSFAARLTVLDESLKGVELNGRRWLDAGCGTGRLARVLAKRGCTILGVDASSNMLGIAANQARADGLNGQLKFEQVESIERMSLPAESFDGVLCNSVIEYVSDPAAAVKQCGACLRDGGMMLVSVPNRSSLLRFLLRLTHRVTRSLTGRGRPAWIGLSRNEYRRDEFARILHDQGMDVAQTICFGGPLPRMLQRLSFVGPLWMFVAHRRAGQGAA